MAEQALGGFNKKNLKKRKNKQPDEGIMRVVHEFVPKHKSIIDIGAGIGQYVESLQKEGYSCIGVDGSQDVYEVTKGLVKFIDLSGIIVRSCALRSDWGLFIEVGEHIPRENESMVIHNVDSIVREGLILSWAVPGQRGRGHINCRTSEYIASVFAHYGWGMDDEGTQLARQLCGKDYKNRMMILRKPVK